MREVDVVLAKVAATIYLLTVRLMQRESSDDLYGKLDVEKDASAEEIRKSYRRLALKWHPDKNRGEDSSTASTKFQEISEAYQVLGDEKSRSEYDSTGSFGGLQFAPADDVFTAFFDGLADSGFFFLDERAVQSLFAGPEIQVAVSALSALPKTQEVLDHVDYFTKGSRVAPVVDKIKSLVTAHSPQNQMARSSDITLALSVSLEEVYCRKLKKITLRVLRQTAGSDYGEFEKPFIVPLYDDVVVFKHQADEIEGKSPGDVRVNLQVRLHPVYKKYKRHHLLLTKRVSLSELLHGCTFYVKSLEGDMLKLCSGRTLFSHRVQVIHHAGLPKSRDSTSRGHLYVKYVLQDLDSERVCELFPPVRNEPGIIYEWDQSCNALSAMPSDESI